MLSAICLNLDQSKIWSSGNGLNSFLPEHFLYTLTVIVNAIKMHGNFSDLMIEKKKHNSTISFYDATISEVLLGRNIEFCLHAIEN